MTRTSKAIASVDQLRSLYRRRGVLRPLDMALAAVHEGLDQRPLQGGFGPVEGKCRCRGGVGEGDVIITTLSSTLQHHVGTDAQGPVIADMLGDRSAIEGADEDAHIADPRRLPGCTCVVKQCRCWYRGHALRPSGCATSDGRPPSA